MDAGNDVTRPGSRAPGADIAASPDGDAAAPHGAPKTRRPRTPRQPGRPARGKAKAGAGGTGETAVVVEALLRSRGPRGATQEDIERVVAWAERTRAEGEALESAGVPRRGARSGKTSPRSKAAANRQQQAQEEQLRERRTRYQMDRALLDGVLSGRVSLDVQEGQIVFLHADYQASRAAPAATAAEEAL